MSENGKGDRYRAVDKNKYDTNYSRIFDGKRKKDIKVEYKRNPLEQAEQSGTVITVLDDNGKKIDKLTVWHKNKLYKQAKALKEELRDKMCTKSECWNPNDKNVQKMVREMRNPRIQAFKMAMSAMGAEPRDCNPELLRRRR